MRHLLGLMFLAVFALELSALADAQSSTTVYDLLFHQSEEPLIVSVVVARSNPHTLHTLGITPARILTSYDAEAVIRGNAPSTAFISAFKDTSALVGKPCIGVSQNPNAMAVGWAVATTDVSGRDQAFIAMSQDGRCAFIHGKLYPISGELVTFLANNFSFLNYPWDSR
jgi:hypothetical protein